MDLLVVPALSGGIASVEAAFLFPVGTVELPYVGRMNGPLAMGLATAVASFIGQSSGKILDLAGSTVGANFSMLAGPGVTGAATVVLSKYAGSENSSLSLPMAFAIGATSNAAAQYVATALNLEGKK